MQKKLFVGIVIAIFFASCNSDDASINRADPLEAGRGFITASLKGNYSQAKKYLLPDSINIEYINGLESFNKNSSSADKDGYKNANIIIDSIQNISDSITIINYSNSFKKKPDKIKLVRQKNEWFVDFKYTFSGNNNYGNQ